MKEKDAFIEYEDHQMMLFVEKEDGSYGSTRTGSYMVKNYVNDFFEKKCNLEKSLREKVIKGELSPIGYYMTLNEMAPAEAASRIGASVKKVKKHLQADCFKTITIGEILGYADLFGIPAANFFQFPTPESAQLLRHKRTENECITILSVAGENQS